MNSPVEQSMSLVPESLDRNVRYRTFGLEHDGSSLDPETTKLLNEKVSFYFVFGAHGTEPEHFLAVEEAFDHIQSDNSIICFENVGYSMESEQYTKKTARESSRSERMRRQREAVLSSRNSVGANYMNATNAFYYAQEFCLTNGYDVCFADMELMDYRKNEARAEADEFEHDPMYQDEVAKLTTTDWVDLELGEATARHRTAGEGSTVLISNGTSEPLIVPKWQETHDEREFLTVDKVIRLALDRIDKRDGSVDEKLQVVTFYGGAHRRGIQSQFAQRGIGLKSLRLSNDSIATTTPRLDIEGEDVRAFSKDWIRAQLQGHFGSQNGQPNSEEFNNQIQATSAAFDLLPLDEIYSIYEGFRSAVAYFNLPEPENESNLARAKREFKASMFNPRIVLESLILSSMHKSGMPFAEAVNKYVMEKESAKTRLFGRSAINL